MGNWVKGKAAKFFQFIASFFLVAQVLEWAKLIGEGVGNSYLQLHAINEALNKSDSVLNQALKAIKQKANFVIIYTRKGGAFLVNGGALLIFDILYSYQDETLHFTLKADGREVDRYRIAIGLGVKEKEYEALWAHGRVMFRKKTGEEYQQYMRHLEQTAIMNLGLTLQYCESINAQAHLTHPDIFNICVKSFIDATRPFYKEVTDKDVKDLETPVDGVNEAEEQNEETLAEKPEAGESELKLIDKEAIIVD